MSSSNITLPCHIPCYFILSHLLICPRFYSTLFQIDSIRFDSTRFDSFRFDLPYCSVLYLLLMNDLCLSVRLSVYLSVWISFCFLLVSFLSLSFLFFLYSFLMNVFLTHPCTYTHTHTHTRTHTRTHTYININICSFSWLVHITSKVGKWRIVFDWLYYLIFDLIR